MTLRWKTRTSLFARMSLLFGLLVTVPLVISGLVLSLAGWRIVRTSGDAVGAIGQRALSDTTSTFKDVSDRNLGVAAKQIAEIGSNSLRETSRKAVDAGKTALKQNTTLMSDRGQRAVRTATAEMFTVGEQKLQSSLQSLRKLNKTSLERLSQEFVAQTQSELDRSSSTVRDQLEKSVLSSWEQMADRRAASVLDRAVRARSDLILRLQLPLHTAAIVSREPEPAAQQLNLVLKNTSATGIRAVLVGPNGGEIVRVPPTDLQANEEGEDWEDSPTRKALLSLGEAVLTEPIRFDPRSGSWILRVAHVVLQQDPDEAPRPANTPPSTPFVVVDLKVDNLVELATREPLPDRMQLLVIQAGTGRVVSSRDPAQINYPARTILDALPRGTAAREWEDKAVPLVYDRDNVRFRGRARYWGEADNCWTVVSQPDGAVLAPLAELEENVQAAWKGALEKVRRENGAFIDARGRIAVGIQRMLVTQARTEMGQRERRLRRELSGDFNLSQAQLVGRLERELADRIQKLEHEAGEGMDRAAAERAKLAAFQVKKTMGLEGLRAENEIRVNARQVALRAAGKMLLTSAFLIPLFLLLALFLATLTARSLVKPIDQLVRGTQALAAGEYNQRIRVQGDDELARLALAFNDMAGAIERGQADLQQSHDYLAAEKARIEAIVDASPDGLVMLEASGHVAFINPTASLLLGLNPREVPPAPFEVDLLPDHARSRLQECLAACRPESVPCEYEISEPGRCVLQLREVRLVAQNGRSFGRLLHLHDITRERIIDEMKSDFISLVSHELRTPLTSILGFSSYMLTGRLGSVGDNQKTALESIHRQARRLSAIISDFLDISRIESGRIEMRKAPVALQSLAERVVEDLRPQAQEKSIAVDTHVVDGTLPLVALGDEQRIAQVLTNLVGNSLKFTEPNGRIEVALSRSNGELLCRVKDSGCGIPPEELDRVFDRFYQVEKVVIRKSGGTGLGLAIVKNIIEAHGGRVWIESRLGEGTQVSFTLPCSN